jgi:hypothetical protein
MTRALQKLYSGKALARSMGSPLSWFDFAIPDEADTLGLLADEAYYGNPPPASPGAASAPPP